MLETLMGVAAANRLAEKGRTISTGPRDRDLRLARTCYDHLAGAIAVGIADAMSGRGQLELSGEGCMLTPGGIGFLLDLDPDFPVNREQPRGRSGIYCLPCLDWSERRTHIGGSIGAALYRTMIGRHWVRPRAGTRAVEITRNGRMALEAHFGIGLLFATKQ
jgi:hypothetical protein